MPGYEPFLLCDFHVHTHWSDGRLSLREVIDLYGRTQKFDVIAVTDHILRHTRDQLAQAERLGDVIVGPELEARDAIGFSGAGRDHDDGNRGADRSAP